MSSSFMDAFASAKKALRLTNQGVSKYGIGIFGNSSSGYPLPELCWAHAKAILDINPAVEDEDLQCFTKVHTCSTPCETLKSCRPIPPYFLEPKTILWEVEHANPSFAMNGRVAFLVSCRNLDGVMSLQQNCM